MAPPDIRHNHPGLWLALMADLLLLTWAGVVLTWAPNVSPSFRVARAIVPLPVVGVTFLVAAGLLVGSRWRPGLLRAAVAVGAAAASYMALCLGVALAGDLLAGNDPPGGVGPGLYLYVTITMLAQAREPRANPASGRR